MKRKFFIASGAFVTIVIYLYGFVIMACHFFPTKTPGEAMGDALCNLAWVIGGMVAWYFALLLHHVLEKACWNLRNHLRKEHCFEAAQERARKAAGREDPL